MQVLSSVIRERVKQHEHNVLVALSLSRAESNTQDIKSFGKEGKGEKKLHRIQWMQRQEIISRLLIVISNSKAKLLKPS